MRRTEFAVRTIDEITRDQFGPISDKPIPLPGTSWALAQLQPHAIESLARFFADLTKRSPFANPTWEAHRLVLDALVTDLERALGQYDS